jgi:chemotaxis protein methyltransferase CheR
LEKKVFEEFSRIVYEKCGIFLSDRKTALVSSRISKRIRKLNLSSPREYLEYLKSGTDNEEIINFLDVISTNTTNFFREEQHFSLLIELLGKWYSEGQRNFKIWSAASSSGEEPYTITSVILKNMPEDLKFRVLATDISTRILKFAIEGVYDQNRISGLPPDYLNTFFMKYENERTASYKVKDIVKEHVLFKRLNLSRPPFPMKGPMDIVFCRNVMIYFDNRVRKKLLNDIYRLLKPGGYLMIGHSESLTGLETPFVPVKPAVYIKKTVEIKYAG